MSAQQPTLGFIGIGLMGEPMVLRLLGAGCFKVNVWNRSQDKLAAVVHAQWLDFKKLFLTIDQANYNGWVGRKTSRSVKPQTV
jgi:6-phosphogluconate dehydrogenase